MANQIKWKIQIADEYTEIPSEARILFIVGGKHIQIMIDPHSNNPEHIQITTGDKLIIEPRSTNYILVSAK